MAEKKQIDFKRILSWLIQAGKRTVLFISLSSTRTGVIVIFVVLSGLFAYLYALLPLQQEVSLPEGVIEQQPELRVSILDRIAEEQADRSSYTIQVFTSIADFFPQQITPGTTPVPTLEPTPIPTATPAVPPTNEGDDQSGAQSG